MIELSKNPKEGFLLVNKPVGCSSFSVIRQLRNLLDIKKIGHAGTLDPFASGLLFIAIGKTYTKQLDQILNLSKSYEAEIVLGISTNTLDSYGEVTQKLVQTDINLESLIPDIKNQFLGETFQTPPAFSAKKKDGKVAYQVAYSGDTLTLDPQTIHIYELDLSVIQKDPIPILKLTVTCSKGTYVRQLASDIANALGSIGYLSKLKRTGIGPYPLSRSIEIPVLNQETCIEHLFATLEHSQ